MDDRQILGAMEEKRDLEAELLARVEKEHDENCTCLEALEQENVYGFVLRAKGMLPDGTGKWIYFDYVPGEVDIREGQAELTGKICVIGSKLNEEKLAELFVK